MPVAEFVIVNPSNVTSDGVPTSPSAVVPIGLKPTLFVTYTPTFASEIEFVPSNVRPPGVPHTTTP
jgi:hypothetical protein